MFSPYFANVILSISASHPKNNIEGLYRFQKVPQKHSEITLLVSINDIHCCFCSPFRDIKYHILSFFSKKLKFWRSFVISDHIRTNNLWSMSHHRWKLEIIPEANADLAQPTIYGPSSGSRFTVGYSQQGFYGNVFDRELCKSYTDFRDTRHIKVERKTKR